MNCTNGSINHTLSMDFTHKYMNASIHYKSIDDCRNFLHSITF